MLEEQLVEANRRLRGDSQPQGKINISVAVHIVRARKGKQFNATDLPVRSQATWTRPRRPAATRA